MIAVSSNLVGRTHRALLMLLLSEVFIGCSDDGHGGDGIGGNDSSEDARIVERTSVEDGEQLSLETAPITDVIKEGTIAWRRNFVTMDPSTTLGTGMEEDEQPLFGKLGETKTAGDKCE